MFVVEFPKSGVTWLSFLLGNIELQLAGLSEVVTFFNVNQLIPEREQARHTGVHRRFARTFIKTHSAFNPKLPFVIHLIRDPRDVMVSYYNYMLDHGYKKDFSSFIAHPQFGIEHWCEHSNGWLLKSRNRANYILLRFEDLRADTKATLKGLYALLGIELLDEVLEKSIRRSTLANMRAEEDAYRPYNPGYRIQFVGSKGKRFRKEHVDGESLGFLNRRLNSRLCDELRSIYCSE